MRLAARVIIVIALAATGCDTAHNVAVSSYRAVTAPVRYVGEHANDRARNSEATTSTVTSPEQPVASTSPASQPRVASQQSRESGPTAPPPVESERTAEPKTRPSPSPRAMASQPQFPVAKAVPGKPGLVYNPFDPHGGYIDVTGYASGMKVKDPDSQKIFIVP